MIKAIIFCFILCFVSCAHDSYQHDYQRRLKQIENQKCYFFYSQTQMDLYRKYHRISLEVVPHLNTIKGVYYTECNCESKKTVGNFNDYRFIMRAKNKYIKAVDFY